MCATRVQNKNEEFITYNCVATMSRSGGIVWVGTDEHIPSHFHIVTLTLWWHFHREKNASYPINSYKLVLLHEFCISTIIPSKLSRSKNRNAKSHANPPPAIATILDSESFGFS